MKQRFLILMFLCNMAYVHAQQDTVKLDLLRAPSSPGASLLGFATANVEKPSDVSAFMVSLQNSFSKSFSNYAVDIAPYWLFSTKTDYTTAGLNSTQTKDVFKQSLVISFAIKNPDSTSADFNETSTYGALGFKFSLIRGNYNNKTKKALYEIGASQAKSNEIRAAILKQWFENDSTAKDLRQQRKNILASNVDFANKEIQLAAIDKKLDSLRVTLNDKMADAEYLKKIKAIASKLTLERKGWSLDLAGGLSTEFRNKRFDNSKIYNAGLWSTFGYTTEKGSSLLGIARYLYNPEKIFAQNNIVNELNSASTFDAGLRYIFSSKDSKFNCGLETIYRSVISTDTNYQSSWRCIFNADYEIKENQKLTFSFGRNFDGTTTKDGNLVAALTLLVGLGNKR